MSEKLYKVLDTDGRAFHGGTGAWSLPHDGLPGEWMPPIADIEPCKRGYHLCREGDLVRWIGPAIYEAEVRGERIDAEEKIVVSEARLLARCEAWNERTARLFAADCAERVLPIWEEKHPTDMRPREAIEAARKYARGEIDSAARDAAGAAARAAAACDAARAAAWDAAWAAAWAAAWDAADAAARAAWAAAWHASRDAECTWQTARLMEYLRGEA
jgi:hypothetical protein